jgi:hypothetical protein
MMFLVVLAAARPARGLQVVIDTTVIEDNISPEDLNPIAGIIDFDSILSGPMTTSGYEVHGRAELTTGGTLVSAGASGIRLTDFVCDQNDLPGGQSVDVGFFHDFVLSGSITAQAEINAEVRDGTGFPVFLTGPGALSVAAGEDSLDLFDGTVTPGPVLAPPYGSAPPISSPFHPAGGGSTPYPVYGQGPITFAGGGASFVGARFRFTLDTLAGGGTRNQFYLPTSAEFAFVAVPEPGTVVLMTIALLGMAARMRR